MAWFERKCSKAGPVTKLCRVERAIMLFVGTVLHLADLCMCAHDQRKFACSDRGPKLRLPQ
eukprot:537476-Amphidinium_carterae.1